MNIDFVSSYIVSINRFGTNLVPDLFPYKRSAIGIINSFGSFLIIVLGDFFCVYIWHWYVQTSNNVTSTFKRFHLKYFFFFSFVPTRSCPITNTTCILCNKEEESTSHLFFNCKIAKRIWCNNWVGLSTVEHNQPIKFFEHFCLFDMNDKQNIPWKGI